MRILVTGANGFVGVHALRELKENGHKPLALVYGFPQSVVPDAYSPAEVNITDAKAVGRTIASLKPDACLHLAGIAFVPEGSSDPSQMFAVNVMGTLNILEAFREHRPSAKLLVVSTAHVYGDSPRGRAVTEDDPLAPSSRYAISKAAADLTTLIYSRDHQMHTMTVRPCNHIGPGQSDKFVASSFAHQLKKIAQKRSAPCLTVGNLDSERDFMDVRDVVRAYRLLIEKGRSGGAYNIGSGRIVKIRAILDMLCKIAGVTPEILVDPARFRPADGCSLLDTTKIEKDTGWRPEIDLATSLRDIYAAVKS